MISLQLVFASVSALGAIIFLAMALIAFIRSASGYQGRSKWIKWLSLYLELGIVSAIASGVIREPHRWSTGVFVLIICSIVNGIYVTVQLLYVRMWDKRIR